MSVAQVLTQPSAGGGAFHRAASVLSRVAQGWLVPVALLLLWGIAASREWMPSQILPAPELVWQTALELAREDLFPNLWISLRRLAAGLALGIAAGGVLGVLMGCGVGARRIIYPTFFALTQVPTLAWLPLFMIVFGIGEALKLAVIIKAVVVPIAIHTMVGLNDTQPKLREVAQAMRLPSGLVLRKLVLPTALPAFITGLRLALSQAWVSLLAVELLASSEGIGYLMVWGRQLFMLDIVFVCIIVIGLVGVLLDRSVRKVERSLIRWPHPATAELALPNLQGWGRVLPWILPLTILGLWWSSNHYQWVNSTSLPAPTAVLHALWQGLSDGSLPEAMLGTLARALAGLLVGGTIGATLGLLLGMVPVLDRLLGPSFSALQQIAVFAWVPLITAWFGLGEEAKIAFVALAAFFPMFVAARHGVASLSPPLIEAARVLRLQPLMRLRVLVLPGAASAIFAGLHLGLTYAWLGAIGAEYFTRSAVGIGSLMINAQQILRMDVLLSAMVLVGVTGALLRMLGERLEARTTRWRTTRLRS